MTDNATGSSMSNIKSHICATCTCDFDFNQTVNPMDTATIKNLLKDGQWHPIDWRCGRLFRFVLCLREDGRLLSMSRFQFDVWHKDDSFVTRLADMAAARGKQINHENRGISSAEVSLKGSTEPKNSTNPDKQEQPVESTTDLKSYKEPAKQVHRPKEETGLAEKQGHSVEGDTASTKNDKTSPLLIPPPCYCLSCQRLFWDWDRKGFATILNHEEAATQVQEWVKNITTKSASISKVLEQAERALKRRWEKKTTVQRRQWLTSVWPSMMTYAALANLLGEPLGGSSRRSSRKPDRSSMLTFSIVLEDLLAHPDHLFHHLHTRSRHASTTFLSDYVQMYDGIHHSDVLQPAYVFGTFQITNDISYGIWREWEDGPVHRFEAVAAPYAMLVFESQSYMLDMLAAITTKLSMEIPSSSLLSLGSSGVQALQTEGSDVKVDLPLPSLDNMESLFTLTPQTSLSFEDICQIAKVELHNVRETLANLQSDNAAFTARLRSVEAFQHAATSHGLDPPGAEAAYHLLVEPHERVVAWQQMELQARVLTKVSLNKQIENGSDAYKNHFKPLAAMVHHRCFQLCVMFAGSFDKSTKSGSLIPSEFMHPKWTVPGWLEENFFQSPLSPGRTLTAKYLQLRFQDEQNKYLINDLIKDWMVEFLILRRLSEALRIHEPMMQVHAIEPIGCGYSLWYMMCGGFGWASYKNYMEARGRQLQSLILPATQYALPSGRRDAAWHNKHTSARRNLLNIWTAYALETVEYYELEGFKPEWLSIISRAIFPLGKTKLQLADELLSSPAKTPPQTPTRILTSNTASSPSSISHHNGPDRGSARKLTNKKRSDLNPPADSDDNHEDETPTPTKRLENLMDRLEVQCLPKIPIKESYLEMAAALFSNAQNQVSSIRWPTFCNFMRDAGCEIRQAEGSSVIFITKNVRDGQRATISLHRPHPDPTLKAVHMRNIRFMIAEAFGWREEVFVARS